MLTVFSKRFLCYKNNRENVSLFSCVTNVNSQISCAVSNVFSICFHSRFTIVTYDIPRRRCVSHSRFMCTDLSNIARYCHSWRHLTAFHLYYLFIFYLFTCFYFCHLFSFAFSSLSFLLGHTTINMLMVYLAENLLYWIPKKTKIFLHQL